MARAEGMRADEMMPGALPMDGPLGSWGCEVRRYEDDSGDMLLERLGPGHFCLALVYNGWLYREGEGAELELSSWGLECLVAGAAGGPVVCCKLALWLGREASRRGFWMPGLWDGWERSDVAVSGELSCAVASIGLDGLAALPAAFPPRVTYLGAPGVERSGAFAMALLDALDGDLGDLDRRKCEPVLDAGGVYVWTYGDPGAGPSLNFVWREGPPLSGVLARAALPAPRPAGGLRRPSPRQAAPGCAPGCTAARSS